MMDSKDQSALDRRFAKLENRLEVLEAKVEHPKYEVTVSPLEMKDGYAEGGKVIGIRPHPASNTQVKEERVWRLQSEAMLGGSERITLDPNNNTHTLADTPPAALKQIADRLGRPDLVPGGSIGVGSDHNANTNNEGTEGNIPDSPA